MRRLHPPDKNIRWTPRHGEPRCVLEDAAQALYKRRVQWMLWYIIVTTTLSVYLQVTR